MKYSFNHLRYVVALLAAFGCFFAYVCRQNLSLAIVAMVGDSLTENDTNSNSTIPYNPKTFFSSPRMLSTNLEQDDKTADEKTVESINQTSSQPSTKSNTVSWDKDVQLRVLGAFFFGYVIFQIPAARAAEVFGAKLMFLATGIGSGLLSLAFPWCTMSNSLVLVLRALMGAAQSSLFPSSYVLLTQWLPPSQRSRWLAVPSGFSRFGLIVTYMCCGPIIERFDWEAVFYISGIATVVWAVIWFVVAASHPTDSWLISRAELIHIEAHMEPCSTKSTLNINSPSVTKLDEFSSTDQLGNTQQQQDQVNYLKLIKSFPIWLLTLVMFTSEWNNMLQSMLPIFLMRANNFTLSEAGNWISGLVAVYCFAFPISGYVSAIIVERCTPQIDGCQRRTINVRKGFELVAHVLQALGCFVIPFYGGCRGVIMSMLFIMMLGRSIVGGGQCQMPNEMSRQFPGTVFAFANTFANMAGFVGPKVVSTLVTQLENFDDWFDLWILSGVIFLAIGFLFVLFGDNEQRNYARDRQLGSLDSSPELKMMPFNDHFTLTATLTTAPTKLPQTDLSPQAKQEKQEKNPIQVENLPYIDRVSASSEVVVDLDKSTAKWNE